MINKQDVVQIIQLAAQAQVDAVNALEDIGSPDVQELLNQISVLNQEKADLQVQLQAAMDAKGVLEGQVSELQAQIVAKDQKLAQADGIFKSGDALIDDPA